ncbi:hypothetical protein AALO_G00108660 [Alosa alosa]|uniref:Uncharacterized protein n=1 Tax=Alosa alosa TaxID=278164 RepID=A0AAV6GNI5_9TELE|nr:hypothetical protein AALO_G00108660 [Alosa alosa]
MAAAFNVVALTSKLISRLNIDGDGGKGAFRRCYPAVPAWSQKLLLQVRWGRKGGVSKKARAAAGNVAIRCCL